MTNPEPTLVTLAEIDETIKRLSGPSELTRWDYSKDVGKLSYTVRRLYDELEKVKAANAHTQVCGYYRLISHRECHCFQAGVHAIMAQMQEGTDAE